MVPGARVCSLQLGCSLVSKSLGWVRVWIWVWVGVGVREEIPMQGWVRRFRLAAQTTYTCLDGQGRIGDGVGEVNPLTPKTVAKPGTREPRFAKYARGGRTEERTININERREGGWRWWCWWWVVAVLGHGVPGIHRHPRHRPPHPHYAPRPSQWTSGHQCGLQLG